MQGCIGILFEQASSRGHLQQTNNGLLSFPFTIRNQFVTALSTLEGARALRKELLSYQRDFYRQAATRAAAYPVKGYVFGDKYDRSRTALFVEMLLRQQIVVNRLPDNWNDSAFDKGTSFYVSLNQPQHSLVRAIFDIKRDYTDSLFYDITSWTMPLAFGLPYRELMTSLNPGSAITEWNQAAATVKGGESGYAYLIRWEELQAPAALYEWLGKGLQVKVATRGFAVSLDGRKQNYPPGTLLVPVKGQPVSPADLFRQIGHAVTNYRLDACSVPSGSALEGSDLGSSRFIPLTQPAIAMITGPGVNATDAGEVWHLLDQRMNIPSTHLEPSVFNRAELARYNTIVMVGGSYPDLNKDKLKSWVQAGGNLILTEEAVNWASQNGITEVKLKKAKSPADSTQRLAYTDREQLDGAQQMQGAIFGAEADPTHPLAFGYHEPLVSLFKANKVYMEKSRNPYATPFYYGNKPLQSGGVSRENLEAIRNSAAVVVNTVGNGRVINIADDPNFRAFWLGGARLFLNAIFFGRIIDAASARTED